MLTAIVRVVEISRKILLTGNRTASKLCMHMNSLVRPSINMEDNT